MLRNWRILLDREMLYSKILMAWYKDICVIILSQQRDGRRYPESASWNDILSVDNSLLCSGSGFAGYIICKLGDNTSIPFWITAWTSSVNLSNRFPELFREIMAIFDNFCPNLHLMDKFIWVVDLAVRYSVKSGYDVLMKDVNHSNISEDNSKAFSLLWNIPASFSVKAFSWKSFHNRLPTKDKLRSRGVITTLNDLVCVMCNSNVEDMVHLFFSCAFVGTVW
ncbi:hypothetical protein KIW84_050711 [Lathyrus oleraceus]|uniref:Reverse transcriptase zinc-binding domain-containing protein n=1 Tax=Pisum sativum TaxID=3888 RepID=A0A9D5AEZ2_PEA|nr:hypothetical protein KIW84_050711 [Pisum sativum]